MTPTLQELHQSGTFVLVNVHDVGSAVLAQSAGAHALGTTSAGHAYSVGRPDGVGALTRDESIERAAAICAAVDIPVSVDAENGWGHEPEEIAETIRLLVECGAAGASIEDWSGDDDIGFYDQDLAVARIEAAVDAAKVSDEEFVICARADRVMYEGADALDDTLARLQAFANVGAGCLYAPGVTDEQTVRRFVDEAGGPLNALLAMNGGVSIGDVASWGVRRVSLGSSFYEATMGAFVAMVREALTAGTLEVETAPVLYSFMESLFPS